MTTPQPHRDDPEFFQLDSEFRQHFLHQLHVEPPGELSLIDATGSLFNFDAPTTCDALSAWLSSSGTCMRLITFDSATIFKQCPRFLRLRQRLGPTLIDWRIAPPEQSRHVQQASSISENFLLRKPVRDTYHGYVTRAQEELVAQAVYFEQLWAYCEAAEPSTPLGL